MYKSEQASNLNNYIYQPSYKEKLFEIAIENNCIHMVKKLIEIGVNINYRCFNGLATTIAYTKGYSKLLKLLFENYADIETNLLDEDFEEDIDEEIQEECEDIIYKTSLENTKKLLKKKV